MQKTFIQNLVLLLTLNLLVKPFWLFGIDRTVQNVTGTEIYGIYYALFNFSFLLNVILDPGINTFNNRNIAQNRHLLSKHVSSLVVIKLLLSVVFFIVTLGVAYAMGYRDFAIHLLIFLAINQVLASFLLFFRSNLSGLHYFKTDSLMSVLDRFLMIGICSVLLWGGVTSMTFQIEWFVYIQTFSYGAAAIIAGVLVMLKADFLRFSFNKAFFVMILKKSYPFALLTILMTLYSKVDSVMLERLLPDGDFHAGIYAAGFRVVEAFNMIAFLFGSLLLPIFARMLKNNEPVLGLAKTGFRLLVIPSLILCIVCFFYSNLLMDWMYYEETGIKGEAFGIMVFAFVFSATVYIFGSLLTANNNVKQLNIISGSGLLLNIIINFTLIPHWQVFGAVSATVATQFLVAFLHGILLLNIFKQKLPVWFLLRLTVFLMVSLSFTYTFFGWLDIWQWEMVLMVLINVIFAVVSGLIKPLELYRILQKSSE